MLSSRGNRAPAALAFRLRSPALETTSSGMRRVSALLLAVSAALSTAGLAGGTAAAPMVRVQPLLVRPGEAITVTCAHFRPRLQVPLSTRPVAGGQFSRLGRVQATAAGAFRFSKTLSQSTRIGKYVLRACQRSCLTKASTTFRVSKIKPV